MPGPLIIAGTGHRPDKLGGYHEDHHARLKRLARDYLAAYEPSEVILISGLALGWDWALAEVGVEEGFETWGYAPCRDHGAKWLYGTRMEYVALCDKLSKLVYTYEGSYPGSWCLQQRNERMVDDAQRMLALWNGSSGGTNNCLEYARSRGREIVNLWSTYQELCGG